MSEEKKDSQKDLKDEMNAYLDKQISEKQILLDSLNAQEKQARVKAEYDVQLEELKEIKNKKHNKDVLNKLSDNMASREYNMSRKKDELDRRERDIENREQMSLKLEENRMKLYTDRQQFIKYMRDKEREFAKAQETIELAKVQNDVIKQKENDLFAIEERVLQKQEVHDRRETSLDQKEAELKIKEDNFKALTEGENNDERT